MTSKKSKDIEKSDLDWDHAERRTSERVRSRAVVSVAFPRPDFDRLDEHVERKGVTMSEFIREATMDRVALDQRQPVPSPTFAATGYFAPVPTTSVQGSQIAGTAVSTLGSFEFAA